MAEKNTNNLVMSEKIYTPQTFVEAMTGNCYIFKQENTVQEIEDILDDEGYDKGEYWNYPLSEIDEIVENEVPVVLVDCSGFDEDGIWKQEYRWFQVDEDFPPYSNEEE